VVNAWLTYQSMSKSRAKPAFHGDNSDVCPSVGAWLAGKVKMVYIDPPLISAVAITRAGATPAP